VPVRRRPDASLRALERAIAGTVVLKGRRGDAAETAAALLALVDDTDRGTALNAREDIDET
jgi:hypothetical protein